MDILTKKLSLTEAQWDTLRRFAFKQYNPAILIGIDNAEILAVTSTTADTWLDEAMAVGVSPDIPSYANGATLPDNPVIYTKPCPCHAEKYQVGCLGHRNDCPYDGTDAFQEDVARFTKE